VSSGAIGSLLLICLVWVCSGAARADGNDPIVAEQDFGPGVWLGYLADGSPVRTAPERKGWSRAPGGMEVDAALRRGEKPSGRLVSLEQGFLAFRPIQIKRQWDAIEFALYNRAASTGALQFRVYYGIGGPENFRRWRHGFFLHEIPLDFTGWRTFRLTREDFRPYGGPVAWLDEQLTGIGLHVTRPPSTPTAIHLADVHLLELPFEAAAEHDLLPTRSQPLTFPITIWNRTGTPQRIRLRALVEPLTLVRKTSAFDFQLSQYTLELKPQQSATVTVTATPRADAKPGDITTLVVRVEEPGDARLRQTLRLHAAIERAGYALHREEDLTEKAQTGDFPQPPPISEAGETMEWLLRAARAWHNGNRQAGALAAERFRLLGDPHKGFLALCTQPFYAMTGSAGHELPMEKQRAWYQSFFWTAPISAARAYDILRRSDLFTAEDRRRIEDNFLRPLARQGLLTLNACANGQEQALASTLATGLVTQDADLIRRATGDDPFGWRHVMGHDMLNGISMEGTMTYMWYVTWPSLANAADMASCSGIDLFHMQCPVLTDRNHVFEEDQDQPSRNSLWQHDTAPAARTRSFMDCLRGMVSLTYPDWHFPKLNDTEDDTCLPIPVVYFRNPLVRDETRALLGDTEPFIPDDYGERFALPQKPGALKRPSVNLPAIGLAILRNGDGNRLEDQYLLLKYGPHGGVHGHRDKLEFVYWRHGKELAPDPPICDLNEHWATYLQQTAAHNTIVIDGESQLPSTGERCLTFAPLPGLQATELEATAAYSPSGACVSRFALLSEEYALLLDRVDGPGRHTIDWLMHGAGQQSAVQVSLPMQERSGPLGEKDGYRWITRMGEGSATGAWEANWDIGDGVGLRLLALNQEPETVLTGRGWRGWRRGHDPATLNGRKLPAWEGPDEMLPDAVVIARRETLGQPVQFLSLIEGFRGQPAVLSAQAQGDTVRVRLRSGAEETFRFTPGAKEGQPTACAFVRRENGTPVRVAIVQGQAVSEGDETLLTTDRPVRGCAVEYVGDEARITALESCALTFLPPRPVQRIRVNGKAVKAEPVGARLRVKAKVSPSPAGRSASPRRSEASTRRAPGQNATRSSSRPIYTSAALTNHT